MEYRERKRVVFFGLPLSFTKYLIDEEKINMKTGFLNMYKIQDTRLKKSFFERIFGLGTIVCYTGDITHPELKISHVKHSDEIKDYIMHASEEARLKRRTLHTMDINGHYDENDID